MSSSNPKSFFYKTLSIIALVSIGFQVVLFSAFAYYMLIPLGQRATDDLSSVIVHAAERWAELSPEQRVEFSQQMLEKHSLTLTTTNLNLDPTTSILPYISLLENSLNKHLNSNISVKENTDKSGEAWFWVDIPTANNSVRFGFSRSRIGVNPPTAFFIILIVGIFLVLLTSVYLTRRLVKPIDALYEASCLIGKGNWPEPIEENGPTELIVLTKQFNKMNAQVQALLSNRTVLLSGIAHDLRTPLTQINLALSMLPKSHESTELINSIEQDLNTINSLINEALSIGTELTKEKENPSNPLEELKQFVSSVKNLQSEITIKDLSTSHCRPILHPMAFKRVLTNLITNAIRYGENKPIEIWFDCNDKQTTIQIKDNGPGIPAEFLEKVFQPFYRLEKSRNSKTGGSGLGLAIVQQLSDSHNWKVSLSSRKSGGTNATMIINN